jgi:GTPase
MVSFVDPRGVPADAVLSYDLQHPLGDGAVIGLMANGFPDSVTFLDHVANAVSARLPAVRFERYDKGNASKLADTAMLDAVEADCDAVIAAYGH